MPISNIWLGTVEGNNTNGVIEQTSSAYEGQIDPNPAVEQSQMWDNEPSIICGQRGTLSYLNATRVALNETTQ